MAIRNYQELNKKLNNVLGDTLNQATQKSYDIVNEFIKEYYMEFTPDAYDRTEQFLHSCMRTRAKYVKDKWVALVYIAYKEMRYVYYPQYPNKTYIGDGELVVRSANEGKHGAIHYAEVSDMHFWDDSLDKSWEEVVLVDFVAWLSERTGCKVVKGR